jgi:hypothetical protein
MFGMERELDILSYIYIYTKASIYLERLSVVRGCLISHSSLKCISDKLTRKNCSTI